MRSFRTVIVLHLITAVVCSPAEFESETGTNAVRNTAVDEGLCAPGYQPRLGRYQDVPGSGTIEQHDGGERVSSCLECAERCTLLPRLCESYECSATELSCNLNTQVEPIEEKSADSDHVFCTKGRTAAFIFESDASAIAVNQQGVPYDSTDSDDLNSQSRGIYVRSTYEYQGQAVYINSARARFLVRRSTDWAIGDLQMLESITREQATFEVIHASSSEDPLLGWTGFTVAAAEHFGVHLELIPEGPSDPGGWAADSSGDYTLTVHILNGKPVYYNHYRRMFLGWRERFQNPHNPAYNNGLPNWAISYSGWLPGVLESQGSWSAYLSGPKDISSGWYWYNAYPSCLPGFHRPDGLTSECTDFNECASPHTNSCAEHEDCQNLEGRYLCAGDVDECTLGIDSCADKPEVQCANTVGSFLCACTAAYSGDGVSCHPPVAIVVEPTAETQVPAGVYELGANKTFNGREVYVNAAQNVFLGYTPDSGWRIGSLADLQSMTQTGSIDGIQATSSVDPITDYTSARVAKADHLGVTFSALPDANDNGDCAGSYGLTGESEHQFGRVLNGKPVYIKDLGTRDSRFVGWHDGIGAWACTQLVSLPDALSRQSTFPTFQQGSPGEDLLTAFAALQAGCDEGYSGPFCVDDDECALGMDNCGHNSDCINTDGSFVCECHGGYENLECLERCPTYEFADDMFRGGAQLSFVNDCPRCQSTRAIHLGGPGSGTGALVGQYVNIGPTTMGGDYTIAVWAYMDRYNGHARIMDFFNAHYGSDNILMTAGWGGNANTRQHIHHSVRIGSRETIHSYADRPFADHTWVHITVVVEGKRCVTYYDGLQVGDVEGSEVVPYIQRYHSWIGRDGWASSSQWWEGRLTDFRVYSRALSPAEVDNVFQGSNMYAADVNPLGMQCSDKCLRPSDPTCKEIDYCHPLRNPCDSNAACTDDPHPSPGGSCSCNDGFYGDGFSCRVDPCTVAPVPSEFVARSVTHDLLYIQHQYEPEVPQCNDPGDNEYCRGRLDGEGAWVPAPGQSRQGNWLQLGPLHTNDQPISKPCWQIRDCTDCIRAKDSRPDFQDDPDCVPIKPGTFRNVCEPRSYAELYGLTLDDQCEIPDLGPGTSYVVGVVTKGRSNANHWTTSFKVKVSSDGVTWTDVDGDRDFSGNRDRNTAVTNYFGQAHAANYVRIYPTSWQGAHAMRAGLKIVSRLGTSPRKVCAQSKVEFEATQGGWSVVNYYEESEIAFHVSVRPNWNMIVMNTKKNGYWQHEHRIGYSWNAESSLVASVDERGWSLTDNQGRVNALFAHRGAWNGETKYEIRTSLAESRFRMLCIREEAEEMCASDDLCGEANPCFLPSLTATLRR